MEDALRDLLRKRFKRAEYQNLPGKTAIKEMLADVGSPVLGKLGLEVPAIGKLARKGAVKVLAPLIKARKGFHTDVADRARRKGYSELFVDGEFKAVEGFQ